MTEKLLYLMKESNFYDTLSDLKDDILDSYDKNIQPKTKHNYVGIEMEFVGEYEDNINILYALAKAKLTDKVVLSNDCSVEGDGKLKNEYGYEIKVIDTEKNILKTLKKVLNILSWFDIYVNDSCGLHIHLDGRNRDKELMFSKLLKFENWLYKMVTPDRRNSTYAGEIGENRLQFGGHSYGIEISSKNTVEVRLHHGTLKYNEVAKWIQILLKLIRTKSNVHIHDFNYRRGNKTQFIKALGPALSKYAKSQEKKMAV